MEGEVWISTGEDQGERGDGKTDARGEVHAGMEWEHYCARSYISSSITTSSQPHSFSFPTRLPNR